MPIDGINAPPGPRPAASQPPAGLTAVAAGCAVLIGTLVLLGWVFDLAVLKSVLPGLVTMKFNAALCFVLVGVALAVAAWRPWALPSPSSPWARRALATARAGLVLVLLVAALTLLQYVAGIRLLLDNFLGLDPGDPATSHPGRMAPNTAVAFLLVSVALLVGLRAAPSHAQLAAGSLLAMLTLLLGGFSAIGYAADFTTHYGWGRLTPMALHTSVVLTLVGAAALQVCWRRAGWAWCLPPGLMAAFLVGLALLAAVAVLTFQAVVKMVNASEDARQAQLVQSVIREVTGALVDLQSAVRGFIITGGESFFASHQQHLARLGRHQAQLRLLLAGDPAQLERLARLQAPIRDRLAYDAELFALRREDGVGPAIALINSGRGRVDWSRFIEIRTELNRAEQARREARQAHSDASISRAFLILPLGTFLAIALLAVVLFKLNSEVRDRRQAEAAAQDSEGRFRTTFEQAAVGIAHVDTTGRFLLVNQRYAELAGQTCEGLLAGTFQQITHPADRSADLGQVQQLLAGDIATYAIEKRLVRPDASPVWVNLTVSLVREPTGAPKYFIAVVEDIAARKQTEAALKSIEWMLTHRPTTATNGATERVGQAYGDVTALNTERTILDAVGKDLLQDIVGDYMSLLETSSAVYEKNGDYAYGIFSSGWCRAMDLASFRGCGARDERAALRCGKWHCHESCWNEASRPSIEADGPVDIACAGGIRLHAVPIRAGDEIVGSINFGYGDPPRDPARLRELAAKYGLGVEELQQSAAAYERRPPFIIELAKQRLLGSARLIGEIVRRSRAEKRLTQANAELRRSHCATLDLAQGAVAAKHLLEKINEDLRQEIAQRQRAEERVRSEKRLSDSIIASLPGVFYLFDEGGKFHHWNADFERVTGYSAAEVAELNPLDLFAGEERVLIQQRIAAVFADGHADAAAHLVAKNGARTAYTFTGRRSELNGQRCLLGIGLDITERELAEEALTRSEERFRKIFQLVPSSIWEEDWSEVIAMVRELKQRGVTDFPSFFADQPGWVETALRAVKILRVNAATLKIFEASSQADLLGSLATVFATPDTQPGFVSELVALAAGLEIFETEMALRTVRGRLIHVLLSMTFPSPGDESGTVLVSMMDITERKRAAEALEKFNVELERRVRERTGELEAANRELESFAYSVSHDLRAPLRGIDGWSSALVEDYGDRLDARGREYLAEVCGETQRMGCLIDDLLELSRVTRVEFSRDAVDLSGLAEETLTRLRRLEENRRVEFVLAPGLRAVGDRDLLRLALENLLGNAWKFTSKQAVARIEFGAAPGPQAGGPPIFFVRDNGAGFDLAHAAKLFAPFQRLHRPSEFPGTGIGLATVQRVLHRHGGSIWAEAAPGLGATFFFTLPTDQHEPTTTPAGGG